MEENSKDTHNVERNTYHVSRITFYVCMMLTVTCLSAQNVKPIDFVIAVVNRQAITLSELESELIIPFFVDPVLFRSPIPSEIRNPSTEDKRAVLWVLIERKLMLQEADRMRGGIPLARWQEEITEAMEGIKSRYSSDAAFSDALKEKGLEYEELEEWQQSRLIINGWISRRFGTRIAEDEIEQKAVQYYEQHKSEFIEPTQVKFGYIKVFPRLEDTPEQQTHAKQLAEDIYALLQKGAKFSDLYQTYKNTSNIHIDNNAQISGATRLGMTLAKLKIGEFSKPIARPDGYLIAKLLSKTPRQETYSEVKGEIKKVLIDEQLKTWVKAWLDEQKEIGDIRILHPELANN